MPKEYEFGKLETVEEGDRRRELWAQQQKARIGAPLAERPKPAPATEAAKPSAAGPQELPEGRGPRAIAARLRAEQSKSAKGKAALAGAVPGGEALAKVEELKRTTQRLKNIYRIVNGAAGVTLVGLIITFLVMNAQLIFGNIFKVKFVPALELLEIIIIGFIDFIILAILFIAIVVIYALVHPVEFGWTFLKGLLPWYK